MFPITIYFVQQVPYMTLQQFEVASEKEKLESLIHQGRLLATLKNKKEILQLYQLKNFYVQLSYEKPYRQLHNISYFSSLDAIHPEFKKLQHLILP